MRRRIFTALVFCLLGTILGAWMVAGGGVLRPLTQKIIESRSDIVATIADEIEGSENPNKRLRELSRKLQIDASLRKKLPKKSKHKDIQKIEKDGRWIGILPGPESPMITSIEVEGETKHLVVIFSVNLNQPKKKIAIGLLLLAGCAGLAAWGLSRWSILPLQMATKAMNKVAAGDLSHRVEEDIGEAKDAFNQMADRVEQLILGQRELIAAISHELRTPLTRLRLQTELLTDEGVSERHLNRINEDINELDRLVEILLSSAKLEQGSVALKLQDISLQGLILEAISKVDLKDRYIGINIPQHVSLHGDHHLLMRTITNILSNIGRYTPDDCTVDISAQEKEEVIELVISDTGEGVSEQFLPRLFVPFEREEKSRSKATGGLGLGLMFVQKVVEAHQGNVMAQHNQPTGLSLIIQLPRQPSKL